MTAIRDVFEREGRVLEGGNRPFLLDDPEQIWFVASGGAEIFSTALVAGKPEGQRRHCCSVGPGQLLFRGYAAVSLDAGPRPPVEMFLAVGVQEARLLCLSRRRLRQAATEPALASNLADLLEHWVAALLSGLARNTFAREAETLDPGLALSVAAGKSIRSRRGVLWVEMLQGTARFQELETLAAPCLIPVSPETKLTALDDLRVKTRATLDLVHEADIWSALDRLFEILPRLEAANRRWRLADEDTRLRERMESARQARMKARTRLSTVFATAEEEILQRAGDDSWLAACMLVGHRLGIEVRAPVIPSALRDEQREDPLGDIARASHMRLREVRLHNDWWTKELDALLAFTQEGNPVALLPKSSRAMVMVDPASGDRTLVDSSVAAGLSPLAVTLYRPLPARKLRGFDLARFAIGGVRRDFRRMLLAGLLGGSLMALMPFGFRYLVDRVIPGAELHPLYVMCIALLTSVFAAMLLEVGRNLDLLRMEARADSTLQAAVMDRLLRLPVSFHRRYGAGDLTNRVLSIGQIRQLLSGSALISLLGIVFSSINVCILFFFDADLAAVVLCIIALAVGLNLLGNALQMGHLRWVARLEGGLSSLVLQLITAIGKLRVAGAEPHAFAAWAKSFAEQRRRMLHARRIANVLQAFNESLPVLLTLVLFLAVDANYVFFSRATPKPGISTGDFIAFNTAMITFTAAMLSTAASLTSLLQVGPLYERMRPILETEPEFSDAKSDPGRLKGSIEIKHVSYRYHTADRPALDDISLDIAPGEFVAFVGPSGSGKSTLLRAILGFCEPDSGTISLDGQDAAVLDPVAVRRQMGVVLQNAQVIPGNIFNNITGSRPFSLDDAWEAARLTGLAETIEEMPMGMNTVVGSGLSTFSGGERQRLMLARAVVGRPPILILDEATSALDNQTQALVTRNMELMSATRLVVAHRLSTIRNADRIYVMDKGRIVEQGGFAELMDIDGLFASLARRQLV